MPKARWGFAPAQNSKVKIAGGSGVKLNLLRVCEIKAENTLNFRHVDNVGFPASLGGTRLLDASDRSRTFHQHCIESTA